jgi:hypothetical protein
MDTGKVLTPGRLNALRRHVKGGGQLGNGEASALLDLLDDIVLCALNVAQTLDAHAPCHLKGRTWETVRAWQALVPPAEAQGASAALAALATAPGIEAAGRVMDRAQRALDLDIPEVRS